MRRPTFFVDGHSQIAGSKRAVPILEGKSNEAGHASS